MRATIPIPDGAGIGPDAPLLSAVRALMAALASLDDTESRLALLKRLNRRLGDGNYAVFIKVLSVVGESDDARAKALISATLSAALHRGDMPCGTLTGWGSAGAWASGGEAVPLSFFTRAAPRRSFDPIAYLSAWHSQSTNRERLGAESYRVCLRGLLALFDPDATGSRIYGAKLLADIAHQPEGTFAAATRHRLAEIAHRWAPPSAPQDRD